MRRAANSIAAEGTWSHREACRAGAAVEFDKVLVVGEGSGVKVGTPYVSGGKVTATVQAHGKGDKVRIVKFRRRKHYLRQGSHRQPYTEVRITGILGA